MSEQGLVEKMDEMLVKLESALGKEVVKPGLYEFAMGPRVFFIYRDMAKHYMEIWAGVDHDEYFPHTQFRGFAVNVDVTIPGDEVLLLQSRARD